MKKTLVPRLKSLGELFNAGDDPRYAQLALIAASNLGGRFHSGDWARIDTVAAAMKYLRMNAQETSEAGVLGEINDVRDLVTVTRES